MMKKNRSLMNQSDGILQFVDEFITRALRSRSLLERKWFTSVLFDRGYQWFQSTASEGRARTTGKRRKIIRPVTNMYKSVKNSLISAITSFDPRMTYAPQTDNPDDQHTAQIASQVVKAIEFEWEFERKKQIAIPWLILTGGVFFIPSFDKNQGTISLKEEFECVGKSMGQCTYVTNESVDMCPVCGEEGITSPMRQRFNKDGTPKVVPVRSGRMTLEIATHFEMLLDASIEDMHDQDTIVRIHRKPRQQVGKKYGLTQKEIEELETSGYTIVAGESLRFHTALANYLSTSEMYYSDKVDIVEVWQKPTKQFPTGFHLVRIGKKILYLDVYPFITKEGKVYSNIVYIPYEREPGCFYGSTPMYACLDLQRTRNRLEALILMAALRMGSPIWILPEPGTRMQITGDAGLVMRYQPTANSNARPIRDEGVPVPPSLVQQIRDIDLTMYNLVGLNEIARGQRPASLRTHSALEKLDEVGRARQSGLFNNYTLGLADLQLVGLEIFRMVQPEDRYSRIAGNGIGSWTVQKIKETDLAGGIDISPEVGGTIPKTAIERQALVTTLLSSGLVNVQDQKTIHAIYRMFGMTELLPDMDSDMMQIVREHDRFRSDEPIQRLPWDNDALHSEQHRQFMLSEEFEDYPPEKQQLLLQHKEEHDQVIQQQQEALMQQQLQQQLLAGPQRQGPRRAA